MESKAFKGIVLTTVLAATMLLLLSAVQVTVVTADKFDVEINEFQYNVTGAAGVQTGQWVEIINTGTTDVDITNWYITNTTMTIGTAPSEVLSPGEVYVFDSLPANSLRWESGKRVVSLRDDTGTVIENITYPTKYIHPTYAPNPSFIQIYDGADWTGDGWDPTWDRDNMLPSKGYPNHNSTFSVKVNEVYYYNNSMTPVEFIEIYNAGPTTVDIDNWNIRYRWFWLVDLMGSLGSGEHTVLYWGVNFTQYLGDTYGNVYLLNENNQIVDEFIYGTISYYNETAYYNPWKYASPVVAIGHSAERIPAGLDTDKDKYDFADNPNPSPCTLVEFPVGGAITPIDKLLMLMPWIGLASAIAIAAATTAITIKKRRP